MRAPLAVIIPVWHGERTLDRSLSSIATQQGNLARGIKVIVAVNDGQERSFALAEKYRKTIEARGYNFIVIKTPPGRKAAFAVAESECTSLAILFVDQDAKLSCGALAAFSSLVAERPSPLFLTFSLSFSRSPSMLVRTFITGWLSLPYIKESPVVAGVYGVTASGRQRWQTVPSNLPDDKFARLQFDLEERVLISSETYEVFSPQTYKELVLNRAKYCTSNRNLTDYYKLGKIIDAKRYTGLWKLLLKPHRLIVIIATLTLANTISLWRKK